MIPSELLAATDYMMVRADLVRMVGPTEALIVTRVHWRTSETYSKDAHRWSDGELWWNASMDVIEEETGVPKRSVRRALDRLVQDGHMLQEKHQIAGSYDQSYSYRLVRSGGHIDVAKVATSHVAKVATSSYKTKDNKESARGTRCPEPFMLTKDMRAWAAEHAPNVDVTAATAEFVDYWRAIPGERGIKLDWIATWRNWMRRAEERGRGRGGGNGPPRNPVPPAPRIPDAPAITDDWEPPFLTPEQYRAEQEGKRGVS